MDMPPALETHFHSTSSISRAPELVLDKNSHSKRSNIKTMPNLSSLITSSAGVKLSEKSRRMTQITAYIRRPESLTCFMYQHFHRPLISPQDLHGTFFRSCNCLNKQKTNSILGSNTTMCFQVVRGFELLHLHFSSLESFHPWRYIRDNREFPTQNLNQVWSHQTWIWTRFELLHLLPVTPLGCKCPRWVLIKSTRPIKPAEA